MCIRDRYKLPVLTAGPRQPWIPCKGLGDAAPTRTGQAAPKKGPQLASFRDWRGARLAGDKLSKLGKGAGLSMPLGQRGLECQRAGPAAGWGPGAKARRVSQVTRPLKRPAVLPVAGRRLRCSGRLNVKAPSGSTKLPRATPPAPRNSLPSQVGNGLALEDATVRKPGSASTS